MNREELKKFIFDNYSVTPDLPWPQYPNYLVFCHDGNKKWFALIMDVPEKKLGLNIDESVSVVNLKCDPLLLGSFLNEKGIYPAYHMNKANWLSVALDGSASDETIKFLLDLSFNLTMPKTKRQNKELDKF